MNLLKNILRFNSVNKGININQKIELIPIIELIYSNVNINVPKKFPFWEHTNIWDTYHQNCYEKAGFVDKLIPYIKGSHFYKLEEISTKNLTKIIIDLTEDLRNGTYERTDICGISGGYVLQVNGIDEFFPQCCGELSDIAFWKNITNCKNSYYEGHPAPQCKFEKNLIILDFTTEEFDEPFQPPVNCDKIKLNINELKNAVQKVNTQLKNFEKRLEEINFVENLNIKNIGELLIWENLNYQ